MGITISGSGNGADMAVQLHVAFARTIKGACLRDAQPFHCASTRFPGEPLVDASESAPQLCDRHCEAGRTLRFNHCRNGPASVVVGMLPDYPRRACGGEGGRLDGATCLDGPRFLGEGRVYLVPGADPAVAANTAGGNSHSSGSLHAACTLPAPRPHPARSLPARCPLAACTLPARCLHAACMMPACCLHAGLYAAVLHDLSPLFSTPQPYVRQPSTR